MSTPSETRLQRKEASTLESKLEFLLTYKYFTWLLLIETSISKTFQNSVILGFKVCYQKDEW